MASTIANYQGNGSTTDFSVPFDYLAKKFVKVAVDSREKLGGDYGDTTKDYFFVDKTTIRFNIAPASGAEIIIRRYTSATDRIVSFKDASVLKAKDLDASAIQTIHIAEEGRDIINDALIVDKEGNWDARGHRIVNVGDPIGDNDAVSFKVYKDDAMGAYQAKLKAEAARDAAKVSETNAKASEVSASESASLAKAQVALAVQEVTKAKEQVSLATQQATLATTKATEAEDSATSASQSATAASASAKNASASASTATTKATNASNSAKAAKLSEDNAALSKTAAGTSEANAKASEVEAKKQADLAKQYANQAASGQVNADWNETVFTSKAFIKNKPTLGALASKDSIAYSEITGTPPEQDLSGLATKSELQTGLAGKAPMSHTHTIANVTNLQASLDAKTNDATLQVDLTAIRESITNVSSKVDGIGDTLSPTYAKKQAILDACDKALNGANPVNADDPTFLNQLAEKLSKLGTVRPLGFHYLHPYGTVPADSIICNGATYSRALYKDFFDYITTQGWVKTEAEWQDIATRTNGFCPFYSSGDDSTNFRTPRFAPYQQITSTSDDVGNYHRAGLPNITGSVSVSGGEGELSRISGTLVSSGALAASSYGTTSWTAYENAWGRYWNKISISASDSDKTYGRSSTVQPESHEWIMCVVAYGIATNVGSVDIQNVMSAVNAVQANLTQIEADIAQIPQPSAYITKTWSSETSWYRMWSDGFIEQGGVATVGNNYCAPVTFPHPFSNTYYSISSYTEESQADSSVIGVKVSIDPGRTNTSLGLTATWAGGGDSDYMSKGYKIYWVAVGY